MSLHTKRKLHPNRDHAPHVEGRRESSPRTRHSHPFAVPEEEFVSHARGYIPGPRVSLAEC